MTEIVAKTGLVAYCGLYCGACGSYTKGRCPGCHENTKASWCQIRACCIERSYHSCAECADFADPLACRKYNNLISKVFGLLFRSNRAACITQIKSLGLEAHAAAMAKLGRPSFRR